MALNGFCVVIHFAKGDSILSHSRYFIKPGCPLILLRQYRENEIKRAY